MDDGQGLGPLQLLGQLVEQERRRGDSMEKVAAAAGAIADDLHTMLSNSLTAALVYPWANDPHVVRVVLIQSADDERRLREALQQFDSTDRNMSMEEWLKKEGFRIVTTKSMDMGRRGLTTFKAKTSHQDLCAPAEPPPPLELEHPST